MRFAAFLLWCEEQWRALTRRPIVQWGLLAFVVVGGIFIFGHHTWAQQTTTEPGIIDKFMMFIGALGLGLAAVLGQLIVTLLDVIVIPLMQYNGFANSPVVAAGWSIVRDVVNMFFVVVLIYIALGTMFGKKNISWQQQVPRLMVFAIVINFSKTLCGLMIDLGQVIMLTFAAALKDIAGGNFIQLFGLNDILQISTQSKCLSDLANGASSCAGAAFEAFDWMAAGVLAVFMMVLVTSTVIILAVILAYRIVMLWVLVVISPIAWFLGGAEGVIKSDAYANWWGMFKCYIIVGPVLTFFMWLTLAVAGSGNIAASSGFTSAAVLENGLSDPNANVAGSLLKAFEVSRMTSFIIGIAMMYAGFDAAAKACSSAGESGANIKGLIGQARSARPVVVPAAAGAYVGAKAARATGRVASREISGLAARNRFTRPLTAQGRAELYRGIAQRVPSPTAAKVFGGWAEDLEKQRAAEVKAAGAGLADRDRETRVATVIAAAKSSLPQTQGQRDEIVATLGGLVKDKKARKELEASGQLGELWKQYGHDLHEAGKGDHGLHEALEEFEKTRPDVTGKVGDVGDMDDVRKIDKAALKNDEVQKRLKNIMSGFADENGREISAYDFIARGRLGADKKEALGIPSSVANMTQGPEALRVSGPPPIDLQRATFDDPSTATQFTTLVRNDASQLADVPAQTLRVENGNNAVARAAGDGLTSEGIRRLFAQYAGADESGRRRLQQAFDNVSSTIDAGIAHAPDPRKFESMRTSFDRTRARVESTYPVPEGTPRAAELARARTTAEQPARDLERRRASIETSMNQNVARLNELNAQLVEIQRTNGAANTEMEDEAEDLHDMIEAQQARIEALDRERNQQRAQAPRQNRPNPTRPPVDPGSINPGGGTTT